MSIYTSQSDVEPLVQFISDESPTELYNTVLDNADSWVNARLQSNSLTIWTVNKDVPDLLTTAAKYYAASDIILSLYNGEDLPTQFDVYFQKAEQMLEAYIQQMKTELAETELRNMNPIKHSKSRTYNQRRNRIL